MTVWGDDQEGKVQIEIGLDETDVWLAFNRETASVQMTHAEGMQFIKEFEAALVEARVEAEIKKRIGVQEVEENANIAEQVKLDV